MRQRPFTGAIDLWALGLVLYEALCGFGPFYPYHRCMDPAKHLEFPERYWGGVSAAAQAFVRRLLAADPRERPTARAALLDPWFAGLAADAPAKPPPPAASARAVSAFASTPPRSRDVTPGSTPPGGPSPAPPGHKREASF